VTAALLFSVAIGAFVTSKLVFIKELGLGSAVAGLIDASLVRGLLVPSLMGLLGKWNWWAPRPPAAPVRALPGRHARARPGDDRMSLVDASERRFESGGGLHTSTGRERRRTGARRSRTPAQRSDLNAARSSDEKSSGSSHAAKWPPRSTSLK
jgi:MMPL family